MAKPIVALFVILFLLAGAAVAQTCPGSSGWPPPSFEAPRNYAIPGGIVEQVASPVFNKDGKLDLVAVGPDGTYVLMGDGNGSLGSPIAVSTAASRVVA